MMMNITAARASPLTRPCSVARKTGSIVFFINITTTLWKSPQAHKSLAKRFYSSSSSPSQQSSCRSLASHRLSTAPSPALRPSWTHPSSSRATFTTASSQMTEPQVHESFEPMTGSWQYIVADPATSTAAIIDPVLNFDPVKGTLSTESADALIDIAARNGYRVEIILETHIHADHVTAASYLQATLAEKQGHRPLIGIGSRIRNTQTLFGGRYGVPQDEYENVFDRLLADDEDFAIGSLTARAIHLPGHTPDHMGYLIGKNVFVGDSIFHTDIGSARADFPGGSAEAIYSSGRKLLSLPDDFKIWVGHDYPPQGRQEPVPYVTVRQQREENKHLNDQVREDDFVRMRRERDESLAAPRLLHPSLQMNIRAGRLPAPMASGLRTVHLPLKFPAPAW